MKYALFAGLSACLLSAVVWATPPPKNALSYKPHSKASVPTYPSYKPKHKYRYPKGYYPRGWRNWNRWQYGVGWGYYDGFWGGYDSYWGDRWGYGWRSPYRYRRSQPAKPNVIEAPVVTTQSFKVAPPGLTRLPDEARVIQDDKGVRYLHQGTLYYFDWDTQRYLPIKNRAQ
ncbi:hypothetical protein [Paraferrimonas sedimenticola]|uniref:YXWGXW repeat-containing protein n=1 Tax=Paraferrimonas sedimenticola TaxID=375674 RepID=A0AA37RYB9_9GAMM|nr:hypothetical protein [Paraferrimonas sedimenticola]GLP97448.1 hypothetical protein GCM10007895_27550 [Paraferrimonas sedimenticola]